MSTKVAYDPALFVLERASAVSAALGSLVLGASTLGTTGDTWVTVPMASFSFTEEYRPDENNTLIYEQQSAQVSLSYWHQPAVTPLYPADRVRATYDGKQLFLGTVDTTRFSYATDPAALAHGATHRCDFVAQLVGTYAAALAKTVCWTALPGELAIDRVRRFVAVDGW